MAYDGTSRVEFLEHSSRAIVDWAGCRGVRMVLREGERRFYAGYTASDDRPRVVTPGVSLAGISRFSWTGSAKGELEDLCSRLYAARIDHTKPWITESGGFWVSDMKDCPFSDLSAAVATDAGISVAPDCRSIIILPVIGAHETHGLMELESDRAGFFDRERVSLTDQLASVFGIAIGLRRQRVALRERVKELTCLYSMVRLTAHVDRSLESVLRDAVELLPDGWLHPESAAARITLEDREFATTNADRIVQSLAADVVVGGSKVGFVEVGYIEMKPVIDEGPFLAEERHLLNSIAEELSFVIKQRRQAREKEMLEEQLRHADRLATIGQLAAGVAHELNEPLSNIMGFAQLATKLDGIPQQAIKDLKKIFSASLHAREVIKELLLFAREANTVRNRFNLNVLIQDGLFFLESRFSKAGISLVCELDTDLPDVVADRSQMLQVLTNLVVNAVQAMPRGGRLTISTTSTSEHVIMTITDTGIGMTEETRAKVFNPFFTTKDVSEGTGLGLSVVHGIIASHGGDIAVDSAVEEGTTFTVRLPLDESQGPTELTNDG